MTKNNSQRIRELYAFVREQVLAGLFRSDIVEKLIEMGVDRVTGAELVGEMERKLRRIRKKRVLVVEDEQHTRQLVTEILRPAGYIVYGAVDGRRAWDIIREADPDVIVTDVLMPRVNGGELLDRLRASILWRDLPVIVLSQRTGMREYFLSRNVAAFLEKPLDAKQLLAEVAQAAARMYARGEENP